MLSNNINEESLKNISGAGGRWTEEEKNTLIELTRTGNFTSYHEGYDWESIAKKLNVQHGNERTAKACESMFRKLGGDNIFLV